MEITHLEYSMDNLHFTYRDSNSSDSDWDNEWYPDNSI